MKGLILLLIFLSSPLSAQVVSVKSGEHGDFTRIVLTRPANGAWRLGRTADGYEVEIGATKPSFDLSDVYRLITNERLRAIWADPETGRLHLGIGCACHAIPFEFGPRNLVIDIRPGTAPAGSSFESPISGGASLAALGSIGPIRPKARPVASENLTERKNYQWLDNFRAETDSQFAQFPFAPDTLPNAIGSEVDRGAFRTVLTEQLGIGATQGVVEMRVPDLPSAPLLPSPEHEQARVALKEMPGLSVAGAETSQGLQVNGGNCPPEDRLAIQNWSSAQDPVTEMASSKATLLAEFDTPQAEQITTAARLHLSFGFGAEARNMMIAIANTYEPDPFLVAMSYIVDQEPSPQNPFANMQSCNSNAALWALLAASNSDALDGLNGAAVARSVMELPRHVRSVLAPRVVARLLTEGDRANAEIVQNAMARSVPKDDPSVRLMAAEVALTEGQPAKAEDHLDDLAVGDATLESLFARVEARFQQGLPVDMADILNLEAFAFEQGAGERQEQFQMALARAYALSGAFEKAFETAGNTPPLVRDVWTILANSGPDSEILTQALNLSQSQRDAFPNDLRNRLAARLLEIGLPNAAAGFLNENSDINLTAKVNLANGDGRAALRALATSSDKSDAPLLVDAYDRLGQYDAAGDVLRDAGQDVEALRRDLWQSKWPNSGEGAASPWAKLTALTNDDGIDSSLPPLRAAQANVDRATETREGVAELLQAVPPLQ